MNWKESLTKGYKHMTIPRKTVLIFAAVLVLPLLVVTVIWTENQVGKAYRTFETTSASELAQINAGVRSVLSKAGNTITTALDQRNFLTFCNSDMEADGLRLVQFSKNELERMDGISLPMQTTAVRRNTHKSSPQGNLKRQNKSEKARPSPTRQR